MGNVVKKMLDKVPYGLFGFQVLLTTLMAIPADDFRLAIQTIFLFTFLEMRHSS